MFILQVKLRKQFPLTSIYDIVYNEKENPDVFKLQFRKSEILLEARNKRECELWVIAITKGDTISILIAVCNNNVYYSYILLHSCMYEIANCIL